MIAISERDLAKTLKEKIHYPLLVPNNLSQPGWPDRFIQIPNSRIVACELKVVSLTKGHWFNLTTLRQTQTAWLAQWQRRGGLCFVLVGINLGNEFYGHAIITQPKWSDWLQANCKQYNLDTVATLYKMSEVMEWFDHFIEETIDA